MQLQWTPHCHPKCNLQCNINATPRQPLPQADQNQRDHRGITAMPSVLQLQAQAAFDCRPPQSAEAANPIRTKNPNS